MNHKNLNAARETICRVTLDLFNSRANLDAKVIVEMVWALMADSGCVSSIEDYDKLETFIDDCNNVHSCKSINRIEKHFDAAFSEHEDYPDTELIPLENQKYL